MHSQTSLLRFLTSPPSLPGSLLRILGHGFGLFPSSAAAHGTVALGPVAPFSSLAGQLTGCWPLSKAATWDGSPIDQAGPSVAPLRREMAWAATRAKQLHWLGSSQWLGFSHSSSPHPKSHRLPLALSLPH
eukprot:GGOE01030394.1.p1 GENE.GGOE01030394.1~~GGOE01030394.1.p1  ORF type:complete len:131 (+),score=5.86 GGOE01030394.1:673-1065(+)